MNEADAWRKKYLAVLSSARWKKIRERFISESKWRCQRCGMGPPFHLHHKTYERLGHERDSDLELLCAACHAKADIERAQVGRSRAASALYEARLNGWASSRYGDDWYSYCDQADIVEEFDEWLDRQD